MMASSIGMLRRPGTWWVLAAAAAGVGVALEAGWLTVGALLSLLVVLAPCLLMCVMSICMRHGDGK